ncbi:MAG: nucleotidyltransferase family protein [Oscillospiraceae bacterium]|nr:nucleotidyltransferase family protein [Oscillospiraceae bacterium]
MKPRREARYLVVLTAAALTGSAPPLPEKRVDFQTLYRLAVRHKVEGIAYVALSRVPGLPDGTLALFEQAYKKLLLAENMQRGKGMKILNAFEESGIDCAALKGFVLRPLYPLPGMRTMGDIDVLIRKEQAGDVRAVMERLGYAAADFGRNPDVYVKRPIVNVEIHKALIQDKTDFFDTMWTRLVPEEGKRHIHAMTREDFYLFMLAHLKKHFVGSGTGIRSVTDVWVYRKQYGAELGFAYIAAQLEKSGLTEFEREVVELCECWFGGGERTKAARRIERRVLFEGVFGRP